MKYRSLERPMYLELPGLKVHCEHIPPFSPNNRFHS